MVTKIGFVWLLPLLILFGCVTESVARQPDTIELEPGKYGGHLQDVTRAGDFLYWAHTRTILKTDLNGKVLASVRDLDHNAGCQVRDGKLYVAVCTRGGIISPEDREKYKLQINVYDASDLHLIEKKVIEDAFDRAGSLAILPDGSFVVGCLRPPDVRVDQVRFYHLSPDFKVLSRHVIGDISFGQILHFTLMFAIAAVAAPGVMCGVLMASVGFVESILGLSPEQVAAMMTFYMALDGYGPAANVTGDGAIALICEHFFGHEAVGTSRAIVVE